MTAEAGDEPRLGDYLGVLRRRVRFIAGTTLLIIVVAVGLSELQTPVYRATAEVVIRPQATNGSVDGNASQPVDANRQVNTELRILESAPVRAAVERQLGKVPDVSASAVTDANILRVSIDSSDRAQAVTVANAYAKAFTDLKREQAIDDIVAAVDQVQSKISELQGRINDANGPQRDSLVQQQSALSQQLAQLGVAQTLATGGAQLVTPATTPGSPVRPRPVLAAAAGLAVGLILGIGGAFLTDYLDDSVKTNEDVEGVTGLTTLGIIPTLRSWKARDKPVVASLSEPDSAAAEAYLTLRTSLHFRSTEQRMRVVQFTSPGPREGKTTTLANLAVAFARAGTNVIMVDCDLRRPRIHEFFGLENKVGLTSVVLGEVPIRDAIQTVPQQPRLYLLASGPLQPNPSDLLSSKRLAEVLGVLQPDIVLIDSPPVLPVTDALILSERVDATVMVCMAGSTAARAMARSTEMLRQVNAPLVGAVLNGADSDQTYGYDQGYYRVRRRVAPAHSPSAATDI